MIRYWTNLWRPFKFFSFFFFFFRLLLLLLFLLLLLLLLLLLFLLLLLLFFLDLFLLLLLLLLLFSLLLILLLLPLLLVLPTSTYHIHTMDICCRVPISSRPFQGGMSVHRPMADNIGTWLDSELQKNSSSSND